MENVTSKVMVAGQFDERKDYIERVLIIILGEIERVTGVSVKNCKSQG